MLLDDCTNHHQLATQMELVAMLEDFALYAERDMLFGVHGLLLRERQTLARDT